MKGPKVLLHSGRYVTQEARTPAAEQTGPWVYCAINLNRGMTGAVSGWLFTCDTKHHILQNFPVLRKTSLLPRFARDRHLDHFCDECAWVHRFYDRVHGRTAIVCAHERSLAFVVHGLTMRDVPLCWWDHRCHSLCRKICRTETVMGEDVITLKRRWLQTLKEFNCTVTSTPGRIAVTTVNIILGMLGGLGSARSNYIRYLRSATWYLNKVRLRTWVHCPVLVKRGEGLENEEVVKGWARWIPRSARKSKFQELVLG